MASLLQQDSFGWFGDVHLAGVACAAFPQQIAFSSAFNERSSAGLGGGSPCSICYLEVTSSQPITEVAWPSSLQQLPSAALFNQSMAGVVLPLYL